MYGSPDESAPGFPSHARRSSTLIHFALTASDLPPKLSPAAILSLPCSLPPTHRYRALGLLRRAYQQRNGGRPVANRLL